MNPQCSRNPVIEGDFICYEPNSREIYHSCECAILGQAHRALRAESMVIGNLDYIPRKKALELMRDGKIGGIEEKI